MSNTSGVDVSHSQVNIGGHLISANIAVQPPPQGVPVTELHSRLSRERNKIQQYERELEDAAYNGYSLDSSVVKAIVINALHAKRLIELLIQTLMYNGEDAAYTWSDVDIGGTLGRAYERGEEKKLTEQNQEQRRRKRKQLLIASISGILILPILIAFVAIPTFTALSEFFSMRGVTSSLAADTRPDPKSSEPIQPQSPTIGQQMRVTALGLNVRAEPNADSRKLGELAREEIVLVLKEVSSQDGHWMMIQREKTNQREQLEGWVNAKHLASYSP